MTASKLFRRLMTALRPARVRRPAKTVLRVEAFEDRVNPVVVHDPFGVANATAWGDSYRAVVQLSAPGEFCSGTLIDPFHVLTVQHFTFGKVPANITVNFHHVDNDGNPDASRSVAEIFEIDPTNTALDGTDMSIVRLSSAAPAGIIPMRVAAASVPIGTVGRIVGFGEYGIGSGGGFAPDGRRRGGENTIDMYGQQWLSGSTPVPGSVNIYNADFDNGTAGSNTLYAPSGVYSSPTALTGEAAVDSGDSGGPLIVNNDRVAAVATARLPLSSTYGTISWWTGTLPHTNFILNHTRSVLFDNTFHLPSDGNANTLTIVRSGANIEFLLDPDGSGPAASELVNVQPAASFTDGLVINGSNGADTLILDHNGGLPPINFAGATASDTLLAYNLPNGTTAAPGTIVAPGSVSVSFAGTLGVLGLGGVAGASLTLNDSSASTTIRVLDGVSTFTVYNLPNGTTVTPKTTTVDGVIQSPGRAPVQLAANLAVLGLGGSGGSSLILNESSASTTIRVLDGVGNFTAYNLPDATTVTPKTTVDGVIQSPGRAPVQMAGNLGTLGLGGTGVSAIILQQPALSSAISTGITVLSVGTFTAYNLPNGTSVNPATTSIQSPGRAPVTYPATIGTLGLGGAGGTGLVLQQPAASSAITNAIRVLDGISTFVAYNLPDGTMVTPKTAADGTIQSPGRTPVKLVGNLGVLGLGGTGASSLTLQQPALTSAVSTGITVTSVSTLVAYNLPDGTSVNPATTSIQSPGRAPVTYPATIGTLGLGGAGASSLILQQPALSTAITTGITVLSVGNLVAYNLPSGTTVTPGTGSTPGTIASPGRAAVTFAASLPLLGLGGTGSSSLTLNAPSVTTTVTVNSSVGTLVAYNRPSGTTVTPGTSSAGGVIAASGYAPVNFANNLGTLGVGGTGSSLLAINSRPTVTAINVASVGTLYVNDLSNATVNGGLMSVSGSANITFDNTTLANLNLVGTAGPDVFTIQTTQSVTTISLNGNGGYDVADVPSGGTEVGGVISYPGKKQILLLDIDLVS